MLLATACSGPGLLTDGTSVSVGTFGHGALRKGAHLPAKGIGYKVPSLWEARDNRWATDELVAAIEHAARRVAHEMPGGTVGVGDLSQRGGGDSILHRSHENGRDADLIYFAVDEKGQPVPPADSMPRYGWDGRARDPGPQEHGVVYGPFSPRWFDVARNWALVRALLSEPQIEIQFLFINNRLRDRLLEFAQAHDEDPGIVDRARELLHQPGDSLPHDDHLHVRIFCASDDRAFGCRDFGPVRWWKKRYKYMPPARSLDGVDVLTQLVLGGRAWRGAIF
jgi:penicillin-insensitive murein endopeptidase